MKSIRKMALAGLLTVGMAFLFSDSKADDRSGEGASFQGKVSSVDKSAQTLTINGQTYQVLATSRITKDKQPATVNDLAAGDQIAGQYKKSAENKMEVLAMDITKGTTTGATANTQTTESGQSFSGRVSKVDPATQTVTVGSQTFQVLPTTVIKRNDQSASFNDIKIGRELDGQYKKSAEGKLELLSVNINGRATAGVGGTQDRATSEAGGSFNGKVSKVDAAAQTVTIGRRTFHILPTTVITTADGSQTTLANLKANQELSGTYKTSTAGNLEILTMQIGRASK